MTAENEARRAGRIQVRQMLNAVDLCWGPAMAALFAEGALDEITKSLRNGFSEKKAYEVLQTKADSIGTSLIGGGQ